MLNLSNPYIYFSVRTIVIVIIFFILKFLISFYMRGVSKRLTSKSKESAKAKKTRITFLNKILSVLLSLIAIIFILAGIPQFKAISYSLLASAGVLAVVLGFATQKTLSNIISGIFLALYEPIRIGDKIKIFDEYGEVEELSLRHTIIKTWDNKRLVIPNSIIDDKEIINYSLKEEKVLWTINLGISYDSDIDKAKKIMIKLAEKHPDNIKEPFVRVTEWKDSSVNLRLYFWCEDAWTAWKMGFDLTESIKKDFDKKNIEIPYPYRTIVYKKDMK